MDLFAVYLRVSTAGQGRSGLGLEAQRAAVSRYLAGRSGEVLETVTGVESGARGDRPALAQALRRCRLSGATLIVSKLDRLSRDQGFIHGLRDAGLVFVVADMPEANTLTIGVMAALAQYERELISERIRALAKQRGVSLNKLYEEFTTRAIAEFDTETRFRARSERGDPAQGLAILDRLDLHHKA